MIKAYRGGIFHCKADPGESDDPAAFECFDDGVLVVDGGHVVRVGEAADLLPALPPGAEVEDYRERIIVPGLIDCHVHFTQLDIIASYGAQLLDWLDRYAYPAEAMFADKEHALDVARAFVDELLQHGTTTAVVFAAVFPESVDAIFEAASERNMRLIAGKVLMDQHCPPELRDDAESGFADSEALIEKWHGKDRLGYAITPRFALTSSAEQLERAGQLANEYPDTWVHTHLAENTEEIEAIARLYPDNRSYLDVYDRYGLLRERSVFAHCLYLDSDDCRLLASKGGVAAFCPTSNLFLGSGLLNLRMLTDHGVRAGLATDVGGGTSLSLLRTMGEAYKVLHLQDQWLPASRAFYLATLGAAAALDIDDRVGNFETGKEADFVVMNPGSSTMMGRRASGSSILEQLFALMFLGDERHVEATYIMGERCLFDRPRATGR